MGHLYASTLTNANPSLPQTDPLVLAPDCNFLRFHLSALKPVNYMEYMVISYEHLALYTEKGIGGKPSSITLSGRF
jgi:hypothetical protein